MSAEQHAPMNLDEEYRSEGEVLLSRIRILTDDLVDAWRDRAVLLSRGEREQLLREIQRTCDLLSGLTLTR